MGLRARLVARGLPAVPYRIKDAAGGSETVLIRALPADRYDDLAAAHPPTGQQQADGLGFNPETFAPALLEACVELGVGEAWTAQDWAELMQVGGGAGEIVDLFAAVYDLNRRIPPGR